MELFQLNYFRKVADYENISKAAEELYISQPALTKAIHNLENELGTPLFDRQGKTITLNPAGKVVLDYVSNITLMVDSMKKAISSCKTSVKPITVRTTLPNVSRFILPAYSLDPNYHSVQLQYVGNNIISGELLKRCFLDIAITGTPIEEDSVESRLLLEDFLLLNLPDNNPLLKKNFISSRDLDGLELIMQLNTQKDYPNSVIKRLFKENQCKVSLVPSLDTSSTNYLLEISQLSLITSALTSLFYTPPKRTGRIIKEQASIIPYYISYSKKQEERLAPVLNKLQADFDAFSIQISEKFPIVYKNGESW